MFFLLLGAICLSPITFAAEVLWLKADSGVNAQNSIPTADNTRLTQWFNRSSDQYHGLPAQHHSGESYDALNAVLPEMPVYRYDATAHMNFNPVIEFDASGNGDAIGFDTPTGLDQTIFVVFQSAGTGRSQYQVGLLYGGDVSTPSGSGYQPQSRSDMSFGIGDESRLSFGGGHAGDYFIEGDFKLFGLPSVGVLKRDVISDNDVDFSIYANGAADEVNQLITNANTGYGAGFPLSERVRIGRHYSGSGKLNGLFAELIVFDEVLNDTERHIIESYLAVKYGITLNPVQDTLGSSMGNNGYDYLNSAGHVIWQSENTDTFKYNVAGLGRDDARGLDQRISHSVNYGAVLTVSTDTDFTNLNLANSRPAFNGDRDYILWATDKSSVDSITGQLLAIQPSLANNPQGIKSRADRNWQVQLTNEDGSNIENINLEFDLNEMVRVGTVEKKSLLLMVDNDGDGDYETGDISYYEVDEWANNKAQFNHITLAEGVIFTIALKIANVQINNPVDATITNQKNYPTNGVCVYGAGDIIITINDAISASGLISCDINTDSGSEWSGQWNKQFDVTNVADGLNTVIINATQNSQQAIIKTANKDSTPPPNTPPELDLNASYTADNNFSNAFNEGDEAINIAAIDIAISDDQDINMASATITLLNSQLDDQLTISTLPIGIASIVDESVTGQIVIRLTGSASLSDYQDAIRAINFYNTSQAPNTTPRIIEAQVNDGQANSAIAKTIITVTDTTDLFADHDELTVTENSVDNAATVTDNDHTTSGASLFYQLVDDNDAQHGTLTFNDDGSYHYRPNSDYFGSDSFSYRVTDPLTGEVVIKNVSITVIENNNAPIANNDHASTSNNKAVTVAVLDNDVDTDMTTNPLEKLTIVGAISQVGTVSWDHEYLTYTPVAGFDGTATVKYQIKDTQGVTDEAVVYIDVVIDDDSQRPVITVPDAIFVDADALYTKMDLGTATATDRFGNPLPVLLVDGVPFFEPGVNTAYWQATDADGNVAITTQSVNLRPLVSLDIDQTALEGYRVSVGVHLNGASPAYPLEIPYTVSGTALAGDDHDLIDGTITIKSGTEGSINFNIFEDIELDDSETIIIELSDTLNRGNKYSHTITINEHNVAPDLKLTVTQQNQERLTVVKGTPVVIHSEINHPMTNKEFDYQWSSTQDSLLDIDDNPATFTFDTSDLSVGIYHVTLNVNDQKDSNYHDKETVYIEVVDQLTGLSQADSDLDGIPDETEGHADLDGDGIADYLDAVPECNVLPEQANYLEGYFIEGDPGVCLRRGDFTLGGEKGGAQITTGDIASDPEDLLINDPIAENVGGLFDFVAYGLPDPGKNYQIVIPQIKPIPTNAVYRQLILNTGWVTFSETSEDQVLSTLGEPGHCPPPGGDSWQSGLIEGNWCVQLIIADGGINDVDALANSTIVAGAGGVGVMLNNNHQPIAVDDEVATRRNTPITIDTLINDTDSDNTALENTSASVLFGDVVIIDGKLVYTPNENFIGTDTIIYGISDLAGGTDSAMVNVVVYANTPPQANDDLGMTEAGTSLLIPVLNNDNDADNDSLRVLNATAEHGTVTINNDSSITYTPNNAFIGTDTINYYIEDSFNATATATVKVTVTAIPLRVKNSGSMNWILLTLLSIFTIHRQLFKEV